MGRNRPGGLRAGQPESLREKRKPRKGKMFLSAKETISKKIGDQGKKTSFHARGIERQSRREYLKIDQKITGAKDRVGNPYRG